MVKVTGQRSRSQEQNKKTKNKNTWFLGFSNLSDPGLLYGVMYDITEWHQLGYTQNKNLVEVGQMGIKILITHSHLTNFGWSGESHQVIT